MVQVTRKEAVHCFKMLSSLETGALSWSIVGPIGMKLTIQSEKSRIRTEELDMMVDEPSAEE